MKVSCLRLVVVPQYEGFLRTKSFYQETFGQTDKIKDLTAIVRQKIKLRYRTRTHFVNSRDFFPFPAGNKSFR